MYIYYGKTIMTLLGPSYQVQKIDMWKNNLDYKESMNNVGKRLQWGKR